MIRKLILLLLVMLALPSLASAYTYWSISASTSPAVANAITPPVSSGANTYSTSGGITNVTSSGTTTASFTVAAAPAGYVLSYVTIDGVKTDPVGGVYTVTKAGRLNHSLNAVYSARKYTISTSKTGNGLIDPPALVASGSSKTIRVTAAPGYRFTVLDGGATLDEGDGVTYGAYTFSNILGDKTISATFTAIPSVTARISTSAQTVSLNAPIPIDGSGSTGTVTPSYAWSVNPATGASIVGTGNKATFTATAAGSYTVTLKLSAAGADDSQSQVVLTATSKATADSSVCTVCHASREPGVIASYAASKHAGTETVSCQACHTSATSGMAMPSPASTPCEGCHSATLSTTTHPVAITASKCADCHDPHNPGAGIPNLGIASAHPPVTLYTFEEIGMQMAGGQKVPVQVDASGKGLPYSPKQTCGTAGCHVKSGVDYTYDKITDHAFHSNQGRSDYLDSATGMYDATKNKPWVQSGGMVGKW